MCIRDRLSTPALSVAESVHDTIKKADSVKDDRLKALIVGKEVSDLTKNGQDVYKRQHLPLTFLLWAACMPDASKWLALKAALSTAMQRLIKTN